MKRLTVRTGVYQNGQHEVIAGMKCGVELKDVFDRLAAIEDILGDEYDLDRLRELAQADREGRCVVLPCDPGQIVWAVTRYGISSHQIRQLVRDKDGDFACSLLKFPLEDFGRRVFLTHAEAEAALRREQRMAEYIEREAARQAHIKASLTTRLIDAIPAADVAEVRHGRWILIRMQAASAIFKCSECGREELFDAYHRLENTPYCHCGALMREAAHE